MTEAWVRYTLRAKLISDAHLGTGSGGGGIDALLARDRNDRPVIWASHVEGVLRDAARRLRGDRDAGEFFGRAGGDDARGDRQRAIFTSLYAQSCHESHIWRSAAREGFGDHSSGSYNRAPKDETLRVVEYVPRGTEFQGEVELPAKELPVLRRLVREVDAVGGGRSTGAGRVELALTEETCTPRDVGNPTERLVVLLRNRDPLCITATATPDNLIPSLAFIPGRTLLGAIAAWLISEGDRGTAALLTSGHISVSDALPVPNPPPSLACAEVIPAPLSLQTEKPMDLASDTPWWANSPNPPRRLDALHTTQKLKRPEDDLFVCRANRDEPWIAFRPALRVRLRNGRPNPDQADAELFAMEQIVEETCFLAELRGSENSLRALTEKLAPALIGRRWLRIGRSGAPVEVIQHAWCDPESPKSIGGKAVLTLTSDLLVRDEHLRWRTSLDEAALRTLIGIEDASITRNETGGLKELQSSVAVHGFNGTSRLWRMPAEAIRRGSVFEICGPGVTKLAERANRGQWLGERTHEGFGRFRLDATLPGVSTEPMRPSPMEGIADIDEESTATATQAWFDAHKELARRGSNLDRKPSLSQWSELVAALERDDPTALDSRLDPRTSGLQNWKCTQAAAVLQELGSLPPAQRAVHARFFVRWLRAESRIHRK